MITLKNIGLAKFKAHPTKNAQESDISCVLSNNTPVFYTVLPERMLELIEAEKESKELDISIYTAYDCAVSCIDGYIKLFDSFSASMSSSILSGSTV